MVPGYATSEYLCLEARAGAKLYVPITDLHLVSRYPGADPDTITLHRLGSDRWKRTRRRAADKVRDAAAELPNLQARRFARQGGRHTLDRGLYARLPAGLACEET